MQATSSPISYYPAAGTKSGTRIIPTHASIGGTYAPLITGTVRTRKTGLPFLLTNIVPQAPTHNRQAWRLLEEHARGLVEQGNELYIMAGAAGKGGKGDNGRATSLAGGKLTVPAALWKVIVVLRWDRMM